MLSTLDAPNHVAKMRGKLDLLDIRATEIDLTSGSMTICRERRPASLQGTDCHTQAVASSRFRKMNRRCAQPAANLNQLIARGNAGQRREPISKLQLCVSRRCVGFPQSVVDMRAREY